MEKTLRFIFVLASLGLIQIFSPASCHSSAAVETSTCISKPRNSTCTSHGIYFKYTDDIESILQLENEAIQFLEANVTDQYCRNYLKAALCVTIYPPCDNGVQKLCSEECDDVLNNGVCSFYTRYFTEYVTNVVSNSFTINCSNSFGFSSRFLNATPCESRKCFNLFTIAKVPPSCFPLKLDTRLVDFVKNLNVSVVLNTVSYKYTSEENIAHYLEYLKVLANYPLTTDVRDTKFCEIYAGLFLYYQIFVPCNITSGTPRPLCSRFCYLFRSNCKWFYEKVLKYANLFMKNSIVDDCTNTFHFMNVVSNFSNSSKDFENDCVDFPAISSLPNTTVIGFRQSNNITENSICYMTDDQVNSSSVHILEKVNATVTTSIISNQSSTHNSHDNVITSRTHITINSTNKSIYNTTDFPRNSPVVIPVLLSSLTSALMTLCFIVCIVGLIKKLKEKRRKGREPSKSQQNSYDGKWTAAECPDIYVPNKTECQNLNNLLIPACKVELFVKLGEGEFGQVYKGGWLHKNPDGVIVQQVVAIKTIKNHYSSESLMSFLHESNLMKDFDHPNVLNILGIGFDIDGTSGLPFMVLPFMVNGDLKTYLISKRLKPTVVDYLPKEMEYSNLLYICHQIACGMSYLATKKVVHRDLAARNCMVGDNLNIKVADFGLARDVHIKEYYRQQSKGKIPVRWMAPEALHNKINNEKSDVWSYGITCWEVFSLGRTPYPNISNYKVLTFVDEGNRLMKPKLCSDSTYSLLLKCWEADVEKRPCFEKIEMELSDELSKGYVNDTLDDLDNSH